MGNSGGVAVPQQPPPQPAPIKDDIATKQQAAELVAQRAGTASRIGNDLEQETANKADAVTRSQIGKADNFAPQAQPRGPAGGQRVRGPRPGGIATSAVLTG